MTIFKIILETAGHFPILVLSGARQVGKSTLLNRLFGNKSRTVVFDPAVDVENTRRDPDLFLQNNPTGRDTSGLTAFRKSYPTLRMGKGAVLAPVETSYALSKNDVAIPWDALPV